MNQGNASDILALEKQWLVPNGVGPNQCVGRCLLGCGCVLSCPAGWQGAQRVTARPACLSVAAHLRPPPCRHTPCSSAHVAATAALPRLSPCPSSLQGPAGRGRRHLHFFHPAGHWRWQDSGQLPTVWGVPRRAPPAPLLSRLSRAGWTAGWRPNLRWTRSRRLLEEPVAPALLARPSRGMTAHAPQPPSTPAWCLCPRRAAPEVPDCVFCSTACYAACMCVCQYVPPCYRPCAL